MKKAFIIGLLLFTTVVFCQENNQIPDKIQYDENKLSDNEIAKEFTVEMLDGKLLKLSELKGKVVLLNFWAIWCRPCLEEFDKIPTVILKPFQNRDFIFLPISSGESEGKVRHKMEGLKEKGIEFNTGFDKDKKISSMYHSNLFPKVM